MGERIGNRKKSNSVGDLSKNLHEKMTKQVTNCTL